MSARPTEYLEALSKLGIDSSEATLSALDGYLDRLLATNEELNLTAVTDRSVAYTGISRTA